jgi:hypothetical protein
LKRLPGVNAGAEGHDGADDDGVGDLTQKRGPHPGDEQDDDERVGRRADELDNLCPSPGDVKLVRSRRDKAAGRIVSTQPLTRARQASE